MSFAFLLLAEEEGGPGGVVTADPLIVSVVQASIAVEMASQSLSVVVTPAQITVTAAQSTLEVSATREPKEVTVS